MRLFPVVRSCRFGSRLREPAKIQTRSEYHEEEMKRSKVAVFLTLALALLAIANVAHAQMYPPPPWSGVMDTLGSSTIHSGSHWVIGDHRSRSQLNTDLGALQTIDGGGQSNNLI